MNKRTLVQAVATKADIDQTTADSVVDAVLGTIFDALADGERVTLPGFGSFEVRQHAARNGRNPQTGEVIEIGARKVPAFKPAAALKQAVAS